MGKLLSKLIDELLRTNGKIFGGIPEGFLAEFLMESLVGFMRNSWNNFKQITNKFRKNFRKKSTK